MATTITMPKLGLTMNSGSVKQWNKKIGDPVSKGEPLYVAAADKLTFDVESPADGFLLAITVQEGEEVPVGAPIGLIGAEGESAADAVPSESPAQSNPVGLLLSQMAKPTSEEDRPSSPKAKRLAEEKGIDLSAVDGTGPNGWIVERDVLNAARSDVSTVAEHDILNVAEHDILNAAERVKASPVAAKMAAEAGIDLESFSVPGVANGRVMKADVQAKVENAEAARAESAASLSAASLSADSLNAASLNTSSPSMASPSETSSNFNPPEPQIPVAQTQRVMDERTPQSVTAIPSISFFADVDMTALNDLCAVCNGKLQKENSNVRVSVNDILMKLCSKLLLENPTLNVSAETRNGGFASDQTTGGTFTISNLGIMDVQAFTPVVTPPEAAVLGVGATKNKPVVLEGRDSKDCGGEPVVVVRPIAILCLSVDHRLVDGADAARFLSQLKELAENPGLFLF
ncbi:MAG: 2-oxo acid dehydrogenase subunit E2 [Synergistaceae bacterium]|jgi:pyruvate dehydrogenase E2 component (dihydrolipoamide acetyltransferase)|nr:2-oxo acid dehydrogenase subunit E2 [Synergistaceae bacterium]